MSETIKPRFEENPIKRLAQYSRSNNDGSITIDSETLCQDFIACMKMQGHSFQDTCNAMGSIWDTVNAAITVPKNKQN